MEKIKVCDDLYIIDESSNEVTNKYPDINKKEKLFVDATPDDELAIRILTAYLNDATNCWWSDGKNDEDWLVKYMNELQIKRAQILKKAINVLRLNMKNEENKD